MMWRIEWILNSLQYRVESDIRDTLYKNESFSNNRWSLIERMVVWGSKHIFLFNLFLITLALILFFIFSTQYDLLKSYIPSSVSGLKSIVEFQQSVFGAQITIIGLIFPLVIAFIGILLQGKSSNESMWVVYRHNSGFLLVGFSALTLSLSFVIFKIYQPWFYHNEVVAAAISITSWFVINLCLSGWFLWKTVQFLSLDERMSMVVKYAINDVIESDIRKRLLANYCVSAQQAGLLVKSKYKNIEITSYSAMDLSTELEKTASEPRIITNVWYRLLNIGVYIWVQQARFDKGSEKSILCLPFTIDEIPSKRIMLAKTNVKRINLLSAFLIVMSIRTATKPVSSSISIEQIVGALFGQIEDALKENNSRQFEVAKNNLVDFHKEIESSMFFINDLGENDNWLLLPEGRWLGRSFLDVFIRESIIVAQSVTRTIQYDSNYYETWCYLFPRLFTSQNNKLPFKIASAYIDGHYLIWGKLMSWMGGATQDDQSGNQVRDRAIKHFVGSWEYWHNFVNIEYESVSDIGYQCATQHLINTSCMLVHAIKYENSYSARWATDVLIHWYELFSTYNLGYHHYGWHHDLLSPPLLKCSVNNRILRAVSGDNELNELESCTIALKNYWIDIRCLTAAYMIGTEKSRADFDHQEYINALLNCNRLESTGGVEHNQASIASSGDLLGVFLRQSDCWGDVNYNSLLERHIEKLSRIEEPEWVSGRIYSSVGTKKDLYMPNFFKIIGVGLSKSGFSIDNKWSEFLKSDAITQLEVQNTITELRNLTAIDDQLLSIVRHQFNIDSDEAIKRKRIFIDSLNNIISDLESEIREQIINAPLDHDRLIEFGVAASGSIFSLSDGPIPISLFDDIEYIDDFISDLATTNILDYRKSDVSQGLEVNRAINEAEWLNNIVQERALVTTFQQMLKNLPWKESEFEDSLALITRAVEHSKKLQNSGLSPIMFIGPWELYRKIDDSKWSYTREEDKLPFEISVETDKGSSYICHLNGIEIHKLPFGKVDFSILLPIEAFKRINIKRFGDGRYVDVTFTTKTDTDITGTLSLHFGIEIEVQAKDCFKYISINTDEG